MSNSEVPLHRDLTVRYEHSGQEFFFLPLGTTSVYFFIFFFSLVFREEAFSASLCFLLLAFDGKVKGYVSSF